MNPEAETPIIDDPIEVRKNKRQALIDAGQEPYARRFDVSDRAADLQQRYGHLTDGEVTEDHVAVAGRIMAMRRQGKIAFLVLKDATGELQLFVRINNVGEDAFEAIKGLDVGDWIGARGCVMRTRRGELSVSVEAVELLTKSLRPLPEKFHGLTDKEVRYRQRYVDLVMNPEVKQVFETRFKILASVRSYLAERGFIEVETPMLHPIAGGANAKPFITHHNALGREFYMRIAPELYLKRLLVGGFERVFELNRSFRNEGISLRHNPEFTMLELYQAYVDLDEMMRVARGIVQAAADNAAGTRLVTYQGHEINLDGEWSTITMFDAVSNHLGERVDFTRSIDDLRNLCKQHHIEVKDMYGKGKLIAELFDELVEPTLIQPTFVIDYPLETSPLAKKKADDPLLTERFELFIGGREYANAFTELNDPVDQEERFSAQMEAKASGDEEAMGYDTDYIRALEYGMPPAGGLGIGIDRLVMLLTDQPSIRDVLLFPHMRSEAQTK